MKSLKRQQSGLASMVIVMLIMIILSTIVLGFSQIIRREQRRSLDRQLSSQAYYAAESGVNDAVAAINAGFNQAKTDCEPYPISPPVSGAATIQGNTNKLTSDGRIQYNCLLIDPTPKSLVYDNIKTDRSSVFIVEPESGAIPDSLYITWQHKDDAQNATFKGPADNTFPTQSAWNTAGVSSTGVIRIDILPFTGADDRAGLINKARTFFLYPNSDGTTYSITAGTLPGPMAPAFGASRNGEIVRGHCNTANLPNKCIVRIQGIGGNKTYVRVKSLYQASTMEVIATDSANTFLKLKNAQIMVDSTGRVSEVSRRIKVRVPADNDLALPENALSAMDTLCKRFTVLPGSVTADMGDTTCNPSPL